MKNLPLVDAAKIVLPPLQVKLGLMKNFVKAINKSGRAFQYLREKFPRLSGAKPKEGIFIGLQIRDLLDELYARGFSLQLREWLGLSLNWYV